MGCPPCDYNIIRRSEGVKKIRLKMVTRIFFNPAILEGQGGRSFFHTFCRPTQPENENIAQKAIK
jgi:hypothetical protein